MLRLPAPEPTPCGSPTCPLRTKKGRRLSMALRRQAGRTWFATFWRREPIPISSMPTAKNQSIDSMREVAVAEHEAEAERPLLVLLQPRPPEVVAELVVEASTLRLLPK